MADLYRKSAIARLSARVPIMKILSSEPPGPWTLCGLNSTPLVITVLRAGLMDILEHTVLIVSRRTPHICPQHFGVNHALIPHSHHELSQLS